MLEELFGPQTLMKRPSRVWGMSHGKEPIERRDS